MQRTYGLIGAISGFIAVATGAFGAHGLRQMVTPEHLATWETAARYQMYHALALLAVAMLAEGPGAGPARWAGRLFILGTVLFSGSLYALVLSNNSRLGIITPFGGVAFLAGWVALALAITRRP